MKNIEVQMLLYTLTKKIIEVQNNHVKCILYHIVVQSDEVV
jgi:hypothetical protein